MFKRRKIYADGGEVQARFSGGHGCLNLSPCLFSFILVLAFILENFATIKGKSKNATTRCPFRFLLEKPPQTRRVR
jgi:hypothetical protein